MARGQLVQRLSLAILGAVLGALCLAPTASATCGDYHGDPVPPGFHGLFCHFETGSTETWTVPLNATTPKVLLYGADSAGGRGGRVHVKLPITPGETLELALGSDGAASSILRSGNPVLVAGGGDGAEPNYIPPEAKVIDVDEPGQPAGRSPGNSPGNGSVYIQWYDARDPADLIGPRPSGVFDFFDGGSIGFPYKAPWTPQSWTVPVGVNSATFELWGGSGESGAPHGHVLAGFKVTPGDAFNIQVGGPGEDTTLTYDGGWTFGAMAAGGDTERPNYVFPPASPAEALWEGGGIGSQPKNGYAIVHFWPLVEGAPPTIGQPKHPVCVVPRLRGRTPHAARRALASANCRLGSVTRKPSSRKKWGRIVRQGLTAGTVTTAGSAVPVTVGKRP